MPPKRQTLWLAAAGVLLSACNTGTTGAAPAADAAPHAITQSYRTLGSYEVAGSTVEVSENLCRCGDPEEHYVFAITRPDGSVELVALNYSDDLTRMAHDFDDILPDQTLWFLERRTGNAIGPLVYFNFEPTYDEAETLVIAYVSNDERFASVMGGGWVREHDSDPRPEALQWSIVYGVYRAAREADAGE